MLKTDRFWASSAALASYSGRRGGGSLNGDSVGYDVSSRYDEWRKMMPSPDSECEKGIVIR